MAADGAEVEADAAARETGVAAQRHMSSRLSVAARCASLWQVSLSCSLLRALLHWRAASVWHMANAQLGADIQHALAASAAALAVADAESLDSRRRASLAALVDGFVLVAADRRRRAAVALASTFASWRAAALGAAAATDASAREAAVARREAASEAAAAEAAAAASEAAVAREKAVRRSAQSARDAQRSRVEAAESARDAARAELEDVSASLASERRERAALAASLLAVKAQLAKETRRLKTPRVIHAQSQTTASASASAAAAAAASAAAIASSSAAAFRLKTAARRTRNALLARRAHMLRQVLTQVLAHSSFSYMAHPTRSR